MSDMDRSERELRLREAASRGCEESRLVLSRRGMMGLTAGLFSWGFMPKVAEAASTDPRLLVVILRGGMDGLSAVAPYGEGGTYTLARGSDALYLPPKKLIKLADRQYPKFFGLHPQFRNFGKWYDDGDAAIVHACCVPVRIRSHFEGQDNLENGYGGAAIGSADGWLNRLLSKLDKGHPVKARGAIQIGEAPLILQGSEPVLGWSASTIRHVEDPTLFLIRQMYEAEDSQFSSMLEQGLKGRAMAEGETQDPSEDTDLKVGFAGAGRLLASRRGPRIAALSISGYDTHTSQGGLEGDLAELFAELDDGLGYFRRNVGTAWKNTVVMIVTEFGRRVQVNGNDGSDHGTGTVAMLCGGAVNGRQVVADWPGLAPGELLDGRDLKATIDLRSVFKGVLRDHFSISETMLAEVFPPKDFNDIANSAPLNGLIKG
ncbi:DUF1501 domain-containing protein [Hansschlegelia zhihuaiae]|uniref:DUF1501 domain-containing protein n=1 Tax=Hansschlegelia zhihuaiae TaxID=405005 RepID=A0A4Q0MIN0_9HYPH|nr:DUF1501 domain-containing protein [Hansschlegelia zhihuaiae]RXF73255.1 DUF1501 domain-containing protein [Hansschlegelia zhihuaiae]